MVMFAGQKYRKFHGYPMDLCSTRILMPNMALFAANVEFFCSRIRHMDPGPA